MDSGFRPRRAALFRGNFFLVVQGRVHYTPRKCGALNPHRKLAHAGKEFQSTELIRLAFFVKLASHHPVELAETASSRLANNPNLTPLGVIPYYVWYTAFVIGAVLQSITLDIRTCAGRSSPCAVCFV
jgi:hypothetical protein